MSRVTSKLVVWVRLQGPDIDLVVTKTLRPDWQVSVQANVFFRIARARRNEAPRLNDSVYSRRGH